MGRMAHVAFVRGEYSEAAAQCGAALSTDDLSPEERCALLCNRAAAHAAMDLNRKALQDVDAALALDGSCLRALLLKGQVCTELGRTEAAQQAWRCGAESVRVRVGCGRGGRAGRVVPE